MKKLLPLIVLLSTIYVSGVAQYTKGTVDGIVHDQAQKAHAAATVSLLLASDSSLVKMSVSDKSGSFHFTDIGEGKYLVSLTAVGHSKNYSQPFIIDASHQSVQLQPVTLTAKAKEMDAVTVIGRKQLIEQKTDRTVVNVDAAVTNVGASALEVLEKSPGVTVDKDGNISLKGKQGVMIMIDGKPSYLSGTELVNLLRNMNANQLDQIEIMTNPPAKYDAAGNSGIINIKTKKIKLQGFNGSVTAGYSQGKYWKTNNSINMNYRTGK